MTRDIARALQRVTRARAFVHRVVCALGALTTVVGGTTLRAQPRAPVIQQRVTLDPREPVSFRVLITPDTVFVGQQATYELGVFITETAQQRMRRNPEVVPAELRGLLAYDLGGPQSLPPVTQQGVRHFPHILQRAVFPLAAGTIEIPASRLTYALPRSASFFSREEQATLRGDALALAVRPLPLANRPADFGGAVGELSLRAQVSGDTARVGEPVVLTVRVSGRGNVKLWPRPQVRVEGVTLVESSERVRVDSGGQYLRGAKEFDWLVTPEREGLLTLPPVRYVYFDPYDAAYRAHETDSLRLVVAGGEFVPERAPASPAEEAPLRRRDRGALPTPWHRQPWPWLIAAIAPLLLVRRRSRAAAVRAAASPTPRSAGGQGRDLEASAFGAAPATSPDRSSVPDAATASSVAGSAALGPASPPARPTVRALRQRWYRELGTAVAAASTETWADRAALARQLRRRGVTRETTARVLQLSAEFDAVAWGAPASSPAAVPPRGLEARAQELLGAVRAEAIPVDVARSPRARQGRVASLAVLLATLATVLGGTVVGAVVALAQPAASTPTFAEALAAFDAGAYEEAARAFAAIAEAEPRRVDAWVNAGSSAWAAGDTAHAVRGWQRALRLDPTAADVRGQLQRLSAGSWQGLAAIPTAKANVLTLVVLVLWCLGWLLAAVQQRQPAWWRARVSRGAARAGAVVLLCGAVGVAAWHWRIERQRTDAGLAIVRSSAMLRVAPGADANGVGTVGVGDVVRRDAQRIDAGDARVWSSVTHADGRRGWLPDDALVMMM